MGLCDVCGLSFESEDELTLHRKHTTCGHPSKSRESARKSKTIVSCQDCDKTFTRKGSLMRHAREVHNKDDAANHAKECGVCPICKESLQNYSSVVIKHLRIVHSINVEVEEQVFPSLEEFYKWKHDIETATLSFFAKYSADGDRHYYLCHRAGKSRGKDSEASVKTGTSCPAKISAQVRGNNVKVVWYKTHVGHETSVEFLRLKKSERAMIAEWIREGIEYDEILDNIKEMAFKSPTLERMHLLKKRDLHNIAKEFGVYKTSSPTPKRARVRVKLQDEELEELLEEQNVDEPASIKSPSVDETNTGDMKKLMRGSLKTLYELFRKCSPDSMSNILQEVDRLIDLAQSDLAEDAVEEKIQILQNSSDEISSLVKTVMIKSEEVQSQEENVQIKLQKVWSQAQKVQNKPEEIQNRKENIQIRLEEVWSEAQEAQNKSVEVQNQYNKPANIEEVEEKEDITEMSEEMSTSYEFDHSYALPFKEG